MFTAPLNKVLVLWKINVWGWLCLVPGWFHHACWRGTRGSSTRAPWWNCTRRPLCQLLPPLILKNTKLMLSRAGNQNTICKIMSARPEKLQQEGRIRNWCQNLLKKANTEFISFSTDNPCSNVILRKGWADVFEGEWRQSLVGGGRIVLRLPLDDSPPQPPVQVESSSWVARHCQWSLLSHRPSYQSGTLSVSQHLVWPIHPSVTRFNTRSILSAFAKGLKLNL